jgi:hypothetical protein
MREREKKISFFKNFFLFYINNDDLKNYILFFF